jgi:hypothetical protein
VGEAGRRVFRCYKKGLNGIKFAKSSFLKEYCINVCLLPILHKEITLSHYGSPRKLQCKFALPTTEKKWLFSYSTVTSSRLVLLEE